MTELDELRGAVSAAGGAETVEIPRTLALALAGEPAAVRADPDYAARAGYDEDFLSVKVPLPRADPADLPSIDGADSDPQGVLRYEHFSVVMSRSRRLARFTAVNIDGSQRFTWERGSDVWLYDPRIDREAQLGDEVYAANPFDRGHLVRRLDPVWGPEAEAVRANDDTFHWTNCAPQFEKFNRNDTTWQGLEDYLLNNAGSHRLRVSVFTGPILRDDDPEHRGVKVPLAYWKVVVTEPEEGRLTATAYLLSQKELGPVPPRAPRAAEFEFGEFGTFQVPVAEVEREAGLEFDGLAEADPLIRRPRAAGAGPPRVELGSLEDVVLG